MDQTNYFTVDEYDRQPRKKVEMSHRFYVNKTDNLDNMLLPINFIYHINLLGIKTSRD